MSMHLFSLSRITCTESGDPEPDVTWTKNGTYVVKNNTLTIDNVTLKDAGQYGCTAENRAGKINATVWIDVIGMREKKSCRMLIQRLAQSSCPMRQYYPAEFRCVQNQGFCLKY